MRRIFAASTLALWFAVMSSALRADDRATLIFEDDFNRNESQETKEELSKGWGSNSNKRAAGNKQVDLKDGAMYIYVHKAADHAVSVTHPAEFRDGSVELKFMLEDKTDSLGLNVADLNFKEVHAGHLLVAKISTKSVQLQDLKTGNMNLKSRELRLANKLTSALKAKLKAKAKKFPNRLEPGKWYHLVVTISGDTLGVSIDGKQVGSFSSAGIAHLTKRTLRLSVPRNAVVDDVKIFSLATSAKSD